MARKENLTSLAFVVVVVAVTLSSSMDGVAGRKVIPVVEVTLANDGIYPIWYMCQMTDKADSLYALEPNSTYRFSFNHLAFPMRWCYLYINPRSHGFFWAYTVRSRCTRCFWSINKHPSLYRGDRGRWERQKLFMPPDFDIKKYALKN
ncbi:hypothetical protein Salat_0125900 [Sesamum alatum]|uniref:S-protein homolog n=1 Tax=Sesamum alatum TaxID=300844 RepID=A0AAE1YXP8_9LAMI|nr:hypothetical protein Salat_0125900 [Sesamum alatum]